MTKVPIHKIKKISINKSEEVASVVEKIIDADAKELILNIPRFSQIAESLANFHLIKRESALLKKKIVIESVDDKVIELAGIAGLDAWNPILYRTKRQFADIVSASQIKAESGEENILKKKFVERSQAKMPERRKSRKKLLLAGALPLLIGMFILANRVLPKADIHLTMAKEDWTYDGSVSAQKLSSINHKLAVIPSQIFTEKQSFQSAYPASGTKSVEQKASGKITIYNGYSSDPQPLVATTRFLTPDGKIFRLVKGVTVPGAKISEGSIIPSKIEADVVADKPGADYNIGPVSHFTIPGFKGTQKYSAFYGSSDSPMTGGYVGRVAYPTESDLAKAKADMSAKIEKAIREKIVSQIPADFKILEGSSQFTLLGHKLITEPNSNGTFSISSEAQLSVAAFKEEDLLQMFAGRIADDKGENYEVKNFELEYGTARADFRSGKISFPVNYKAVLAEKVDAGALKAMILGKSESDLRLIIYSLPSISKTRISLWPFWVKSVPNNEGKISIAVD